MSERKPIQYNIEDTNFIYTTNFSGLPERDRYGDSRRKVNVLIPDLAQVRDLKAAGFKVRSTKPRPTDDPATYQPKYFVQAILRYRKTNGEPVKWPPKVYLVVGGNEPVLLNEDNVACLDNIRVKNVNVVLNPHEYDPVTHEENLYINTMYVEQRLDDDPYAARYRRQMTEEDE